MGWLAGQAGVWPAIFTGAYKTDRNTTWRATVNYTLLFFCPGHMTSSI